MWPNQKVRLYRLENQLSAASSTTSGIDSSLAIIDLRVDNLVSYLQNDISIGSPILINQIGSYTTGVVLFTSPISTTTLFCSETFSCTAYPIYTHHLNPFISPRVYQSQSPYTCDITIPKRFSLYVTILSTQLILASPVNGTPTYTYHDFLKFHYGADVTFVFNANDCTMTVVFYQPGYPTFEVSVLTLC